MSCNFTFLIPFPLFIQPFIDFLFISVSPPLHKCEKFLMRAADGTHRARASGRVAGLRRMDAPF